MNELHMVSLPWGGEISFYVFLLALSALVAAVWTVYRAHRHEVGAAGAVLFALLSGVFSLALGRAVYCAVRYERMFFDPRGEFVGLAPFLDLSEGGFSVIGVILGVLFAALIAGPVTRSSGLAMLDSAAVPGLALFTAERLIEPLNGMGFGDLVTDERLCRFPFAIENSFGDFSLSVCFIEAALAVLVLLFLFIFDRFCKKKGTLAGVGLALLCATQIMPESLRLDDVLYLFIFARVTQIGYAVLLFGTLAAALIRGGRRGLSGGKIALEIILMLAGIGVCVGAEFALDKTNLPDLAVYGVMIAVLLALCIMTLHRLIKEDRIGA